MNIKPYQAYEKDFESEDVGVSCWISDIDAESGDKYKQYMYQNLREEFGNKLLNFLERFKSPCVVEVFEKRIKRKHSDFEWADGEEIKIYARITNVSKREVVLSTYSSYPLEHKKLSFLQRLEWAFTGKVK